MLTELSPLRARALVRTGLTTADGAKHRCRLGFRRVPPGAGSRRAPDLHPRPALAFFHSNDELALVASVRFGLGGLGPLAGAADCSSRRRSRQCGPGASGPWTEPAAAHQSRISNPASAVVLPRSPRAERGAL